MSILVVGSVAFDSIETPKGKRDRCLGGAATYFALAASYFTDVRVIAVVGEDFTAEHEAVLTRRGVDTQGLEHTAGKSFHWTGSYVKSFNEAQTLNTELNVFETFAPKVPAAYKDSEFLFLANIDPGTAKQRSPADAQGPHGMRRHHELLDHRPSRKSGQSAHRTRCAPDQRWRGQAAGRQQQPGSGRAQNSGHGPKGSDRQTRRIWRHGVLRQPGLQRIRPLPKSRCLSAHQPCRWKR